MAVVAGHFIVEGSPVSVTEVRQVLGASATTVIGLCQHPNIVKFARRKPYAFGGVLPNGLYGVTGTDESICEANNFGMSPTVIALPKNDGEASIDGCAPRWGQWRVPSGRSAQSSPSGNDEPCRLGDFRGYDSMAGRHIVNYEVFIDDSETAFPYLQPAVNGKTRVRLTFRPADMSVRLSDFTYGGVKLSDMYLTLIIANHQPSYKAGSFNVAEKWGKKIVYKQSDEALSDVIGLSTAANVIEVELDTSGLSTAVLNEFRNSSSAYGSSTKIFAAVGLAPRLPETGDVTGFGNGWMVEADGVMPFGLVNFNMWNETWETVRINDDFLANATGTIYNYDVPCMLTVVQQLVNGATCTASYDAAAKQVVVKPGGTYTASPYASGIEAGLRTEGHLGFRFDIYVLDEDGAIAETGFYSIFTNKGVGEQRSVRFENGLLVAGQSDTGNFSATEQQSAAEYIGTKTIPGDGLLRIDCPDLTAGTKAEIEIYCYIVSYPSTDGADKYYPNITTRTDYPGAETEKMIKLEVTI